MGNSSKKSAASSSGGGTSWLAQCVTPSTKGGYGGVERGKPKPKPLLLDPSKQFTMAEEGFLLSPRRSTEEEWGRRLLKAFPRARVTRTS